MVNVFVIDPEEIRCLGVQQAIKLAENPELTFMGFSTTSPVAIPSDANLVLVNKTLFANIIPLCLTTTTVVVWGGNIFTSEQLLLLHSGVRGLLTTAADPKKLVMCLIAAPTRIFMDTDLVHSSFGFRGTTHRKTELTDREQQVRDLVEQGMKNKDVAHELGIRPGTVKIHLRHIFEKTGVRGRLGLALRSVIPQ